MTATTDRPIRSGLEALEWRTRHSHWLPTTIAASIATIAIPVIEIAATGMITLDAAPLAGPWAGYAAAALMVPKLRRRAAADMRVAGTAGQVRRGWDTYMETGGVDLHRAARGGKTRTPPRVRTIRHDENGNIVVTAESAACATATEWAAKADALSKAVDLPRPTITSLTGGRVTLTFDGKTRPGETSSENDDKYRLPEWEAPTPDENVDLRAIPIAKKADGDIVNFQLLHMHALLVGATRAGKSSALWAIINGIAPAVRDRRVELWGIDPKFLVEFGKGRELFTRLVGGEDDLETAIVTIVKDLYEVMRQRGKMMEVNRVDKFFPTPGDPAYAFFIDEVLMLSSTFTDSRKFKEMDKYLRRILTQGAACGVSVISASQLGQADALGKIRDLSPLRICFRVPTRDLVDCSLGEGSWAMGAKADKIPIGEKLYSGTAYMLTDGLAPELVRFPWVSRDHIRWLVDNYAPAQRPAPVGPPATLPVEDAPARPASPTRDHIHRLLDEGWTDTTRIAREVGCTTRWVRQTITARREEEARAGMGDPQRGANAPRPPGGSTHASHALETAKPGGTPSSEVGSPGRNFVPEGDPTSVVKPTPHHLFQDLSDLDRPDPLRAVP